MICSIDVGVIEVTGVFSVGKKWNCWTIVQMAIFICSMAKRVPGQPRGPNPNGRKVLGSMLPLLSSLHLFKKSKNWNDSPLVIVIFDLKSM